MGKWKHTQKHNTQENQEPFPSRWSQMLQGTEKTAKKKKRRRQTWKINNKKDPQKKHRLFKQVQAIMCLFAV